MRKPMAVLCSCTSNNYSYKLPMTALQSVVQLTGYTATSNECHQLKRQPAQTNTIAMHYQIWLQKFFNTTKVLNNTNKADVQLTRLIMKYCTTFPE